MLSQPHPFLREATLFTARMVQPRKPLSDLCHLPTADWAKSGYLDQAGPECQAEIQGCQSEYAALKLGNNSFWGLEVASWGSKTKPELLPGRAETEIWEKEPVRE